MCVLAIVVVNSLTLTSHIHRSRILVLADFRYWLIRELLIFATFWAAGMGIG